ncbi:helix-turn-helix domain-containing protein [Candidatus Symbiopectobacterium endolongispinus]|nr:hypothetical protein [Candidatus Symbiopectobacterium sp. PLON1]MBT9429117.1 helix-turn-helix domain-containing protein [Candidatus Symbiopectobacterium endolongispinus]
MNKTAGIQVISRAIKILRLLHERGTSLGELARLTDLPRSTVQRIVDTLAAEHLVECGWGGASMSWREMPILTWRHSCAILSNCCLKRRVKRLIFRPSMVRK